MAIARGFGIVGPERRSALRVCPERNADSSQKQQDLDGSPKPENL